jgi:hypothetical protein
LLRWFWTLNNIIRSEEERVTSIICLLLEKEQGLKWFRCNSVSIIAVWCVVTAVGCTFVTHRVVYRHLRELRNATSTFAMKSPEAFIYHFVFVGRRYECCADTCLRHKKKVGQTRKLLTWK